MAKKQYPGQCTIEGCLAKEIYCRGLCTSHYVTLLTSVRKKIKTWEQYEALKMSVPPKRIYHIGKGGLVNTMLIKLGQEPLV